MENEKMAKAHCRGCGMELKGEPYYMGGSVYHPNTGERCKTNYYGGFVCSSRCDFKSSLELEHSMPGHDGRQRSLGCYAKESFDNNWKE